MPRGFTKQPNPEESAALTHAVLEHELFKRCFEQVAVSRISGERPSVEVYALCKGSCNMTAEDRWKHPCTSSRPRSGAFDPAKCLTEALKDLLSRLKECFQPQITELTWERLASSWAVAGPSGHHLQHLREYGRQDLHSGALLRAYPCNVVQPDVAAGARCRY